MLIDPRLWYARLNMTQITPNSAFSNTNQQLTYYRVQAYSNHPRLEHAIFTRNGGVSHAPYRSLNMSTSVGDSPQVVKKNIDCACQAVNIDWRRSVRRQY